MSKSNWVHLFLGVLGAGLLVWMVKKIGPDVLLQSLSAFGLWKTLFLIAAYAIAQLAFFQAWRSILLAYPKRPGFGAGFRAYLAGDALNMTVPSANLAGEPVKVMLVRDQMPAEDGIASVAIYKFADFISLTIFLMLGWGLQFFFYDLPAAWSVGGGVIALGMTGACALIYALQKKGMFHPAGRFLSKIGIERVEKKLESAHFIDHSIREFYVRHPKLFRKSVFYNFLAWFGGVAEIWLFLKLTGNPASLAAALTIETFSLFINNVTFFVPARIGVGEGGRVLLFTALGYPAATGLSYGILRRVRELAWVALGLFVMVAGRKNQKRPLTNDDSLKRNSISPI